jgi:hypothetical protein
LYRSYDTTDLIDPFDTFLVHHDIWQSLHISYPVRDSDGQFRSNIVGALEHILNRQRYVEVGQLTLIRRSISMVRPKYTCEPSITRCKFNSENDSIQAAELSGAWLPWPHTTLHVYSDRNGGERLAIAARADLLRSTECGENWMR